VTDTKLQFKREKIKDVWQEMLPIFKLHWQEIAHYHDIPLDPDEETYFKLDDMNALRTYVARDGRSKIIGYQVFFIKNNIHYKSSKQAVQDVLFIEKEHRGAGWKFINWCDLQLFSEGVQVSVQHIKAAHNFGSTLERLGYELQDLIYTRRLDLPRKGS
jgi:hypothetical protein